jgi:hypothetical protein
MSRTEPVTPAVRWARLAIVAAGLLLPALSLIPLGSLWLWQHGLLFYWAFATLAAVFLAFGAQRWIFPPHRAVPAPEPAPVEAEEDVRLGATLGWSPLEEQAWRDVQLLARRTDPDRIDKPEDLVTLGQEAVEAVARRMHPETTDPLWQFTVPEALAIVERVARQLRRDVLEKVPFGDRMTVAQALSLYRWRGAVDMAERAYDVWRLIRLANPISAATQEARDRLSKALIAWGKDEVARRLTSTFVREVGRAAIELYGGRLRVTALDSYVSDETIADRAYLGDVRAEPLRILVAGQVGAGKSSLVNALAREADAAVDVLPATASFTPYALNREGFPAALLIDSPGLLGEPQQTQALIEKATDCDLVLWVVAVNRADRAVDREALDAFRRYFAARLNRRRPPLVLVATHIDLLRPFGEWTPPYDLTGDRPKAQSIRAAVAAAASDLGFVAEEAVPVSLASPKAAYNVEALWARIAETLPEAMRAQLLRCLSGLRGRWSWSSLWSEAGKAGRAIAGALRT